MRISTGHQMTPSEILDYLGDNFCRQARRTDLTQDEKIDALIGNVEQAKKTAWSVENIHDARDMAAPVFQDFRTSTPSGEEFAPVEMCIIRAANGLGIRLG